jgi:hypothetical protein
VVPSRPGDTKPFSIDQLPTVEVVACFGAHDLAHRRGSASRSSASIPALNFISAAFVSALIELGGDALPGR